MSDAHGNGSRLALLQIDAAVCGTLRATAPLIETNMEAILGGFYKHMGGFDEVKALVAGHSPEHLKQAQRKHWQALFSGKFDETYQQRARSVGQAHERIGLKPSWYIGGYTFILTRMVDAVLSKHRRSPDTAAETLRALIKAVMLDMDIAISVYIADGDEKRRQQTLTIADQVETEVHTGVRTVSVIGERAGQAATRLSDSIAVLSSEAETVSSEANDASINVEIIAAASQQLASSVNEIGQQVELAQETARAAVREVSAATQAMCELAAAGEQIGQIVKLISRVASQTNLLALNATIEAARAGQAGRGFAVVAGEVKNLANQTRQATQDIARQIESIQERSANAVAIMSRVERVINEVDLTSSSIAAAIEQQTAATAEISRAVNGAATGTRNISQHLIKQAEEARDTRDFAGIVRCASENTTNSLTELEQRVGGLINNLRTPEIFDRGGRLSSPRAHQTA